MSATHSDLTRLRRKPARGAHDRATIDAILDEALVAHLGFVDADQPYAIPTLHARVGDTVYVHGSAASRTLRALANGASVCLTATLIDGLVLARSAGHHSVNYRSVIVFGVATPVEDPEERGEALRLFTERLVPGRWQEVRPPTVKELKGVGVLSIPIDEASAKIRTGPPIDDPEDYDLPVWAGVLPLGLTAGAPIADARLKADAQVPTTVTRWREAR